MSNCKICKSRLDDPADPDLTADCGGDCVRCMAWAGDEDCARKVARIMAGDPCDEWKGDLP